MPQYLMSPYWEDEHETQRERRARLFFHGTVIAAVVASAAILAWTWWPTTPPHTPTHVTTNAATHCDH